MPDESNLRVPFETIVDLFASRGVEFIVIGGQAEILLGGNRVTFDTDLCYRRTRENLERLANALKEIRPTLRGAPPDLPFQLEARTLELGNNFTFKTTAGDLDLLGYVEPIGGYEELLRSAETVPFGTAQLHVASLDDLIRIKRHIKRFKDSESLAQLLAIKRIREESRDG
jgi:predicted nucleotidyltransferase